MHGLQLLWVSCCYKYHICWSLYFNVFLSHWISTIVNIECCILPYNPNVGSIMQSLCWNCDTNILAAVQDTSLMAWYYPTVTFVDKRLISQTTLVKDTRFASRFPHHIFTFILSKVLLLKYLNVILVLYLYQIFDHGPKKLNTFHRIFNSES